jgi:hypothetical protein
MTYNSLIHREQGGSVMNIGSTASLNIQSGGSLNVQPSGKFTLQNLDFSTGRNLPTYSASPGSLYLRTDGSVSGLYVNKSSGTAGSVWGAASVNLA